MSQSSVDKLDIAKQSRLDVLKERADKMGLSYSPQIGENALAKKIEEALGEADNEGLDADALSRRDSEQLFRVVLHPIDPRRKQRQGEVITVSNSLGAHKKFILYGKPWHVPKIILEALKGAKYLEHYKATNKHGIKVTKNRISPAFVVDTLQPLTDEELQVIAARQSGGTHTND